MPHLPLQEFESWEGGGGVELVHAPKRLILTFLGASSHMHASICQTIHTWHPAARSVAAAA